MTKCSVDWCEKHQKYLTKGLCAKHYTQMVRHGHIFYTKTRNENEIILHENYAEVCIYNLTGEEKFRAIIDLENVDLIKKYMWCIDRDGIIARKDAEQMFFGEFAPISQNAIIKEA